MRNIPATMATQHPDNAFAPYWDAAGRPFIGSYQEIVECLACFKDLGVSEFMWDWEGKHADAAVIDRFFSEHYDYFAKHQLGRDKFLTFRLPNIWEEKGYSLLQAMTVLLTSEDFARDLNFDSRPLFEVILPMTERADQLMHMHKLFQKLANFKSHEFMPNQKSNTDYLELIPLTESVESQQDIRGLLDEYVQLHQKHFGRAPAYIRPFLARSDPALVSGLLATVIANKLALSQIYEFSEDSGIPVFPISGVGSLPFRGGLTPETVDEYLLEYPGMRTVSVQSAFRYDYPKTRVKAAIVTLEREMPKTTAHIVAHDRRKSLQAIAKQSAEIYQKTLSGIAADMTEIFAAVPRRRDRRQHIGLLAYGRSMGSQQLPRAITFTAGMYSIGVPPELIGFGRTLHKLSAESLALLGDEYHLMKQNLERAGRFLNSDNLAILARRNRTWKGVQQDIAMIEQTLGLRLQPRTTAEKAHKNLSSNTLILKQNRAALTELITEMAELRKSLG